ncbi:MAG: hypothetical protein NTW21_22390 [Verrucomicrobia bacterium]|nr:hypothetical protein [Verrucomicrobiota bacterium]
MNTTTIQAMSPADHHTNKPLPRLPRTLALACGWLLGLVTASAQLNITSNAAYQADFQGKNAVHAWTIDLPGDFNSLRIQVESPTAELVVALIPSGNERPIRLVPMPNKGRISESVRVRGMSIEATQDPKIKLASGRYIIQIKPNKNAGPAGKYSVKIVEPVYPQAPPPAAGAPEQKEPKPAPAASAPALDQKAELRALTERLNAVEKRLEALEKSRQTGE